MITSLTPQTLIHSSILTSSVGVSRDLAMTKSFTCQPNTTDIDSFPYTHLKCWSFNRYSHEREFHLPDCNISVDFDAYLSLVVTV
jgi:hypothetical protein